MIKLLSRLRYQYLFFGIILVCGFKTVAQPTLTFSPLNGATNVAENVAIMITSNENLSRADNTTLDNTNIGALVKLKINNAAGINIPFTAVLDDIPTNKIIKITPNSILPSNTIIYVEIKDLQGNGNMDMSPNPQSFTFTTGDTQDPIAVFNPLNNATNVSVSNNLTITFNEAIRKTDDSPITAGDLNTLIELKLTDNSGAAEPFTASIDGTNKIITVNPTSNLQDGTLYYFEINSVEDAADNDFSTTNITFTTVDLLPPVPTFTPLNGATSVNESANIVIDFNEPIRRIYDNVDFINNTIDFQITLKLTNSTGGNIPFDATINGSNKQVIIDPTSALPGNSVIYVAIDGVEDGSDNLINPSPTSITFTTADTQAPSIIFNPSNSSTNISVLGNLTITFNEAVRKIDDTPITNTDLNTLIELKLNDNSGAVVPFSATIDVTKQLITINPTTNLSANTTYYLEINPVEDAANNATTQNITFITESIPSITSFSPSGGTCIGDDVTVDGTRFTGTGNPITGNTKPVVTLNGVSIPPSNIVSYTPTQLVFTLPIGSTSGPITVKNIDSNLTSNNSSNLNVFPAINQSLTVTPATLTPAQNTNVNVDISNSQDNNYTYSLILTGAPVGYSVTPPSTVNTAPGNNGSTLTLNTSPNLNKIGSYIYRIDVSRTGCTTKKLSNTPFTLKVDSLAVDVSATATAICGGSSAILIGSTSGGTGFYQFSWSGPSFNSTSSSPTITPAYPAGTGWYVLKLTDNSLSEAKDSVYITTYPSFVVNFIPSNGLPTVRTEFPNQNQLFELNGSPSQLINGGATFSGAGVVALPDSNKYYFNPQLAGNGIHVITYTYFNGTCSKSTTLNFRVSDTFIDNLDPTYCVNDILSDPISLSSIGVNYLTTYYPSYTFTRLRFLKFEYKPSIGYVYNYYDAISDPLLEPLYRPNPISQPNVYRLNIEELVANHGLPPKNTYYYVVVFASDAAKAGNVGYVDEAVLYNYFSVVPLGLPPSIVGINETENICSNAIPITLSQSINGYGINNFTITSPYSASLSGTKNKIFDPNNGALISAGTDQIPLKVTLNYDDFNGCVNTVSRNFNWVKKPASPNAPDISYCKTTDGSGAKPFTINSQPNGPGTHPYWYGQDPVANSDRATNPVLDSINFNGFVAPGITGLVGIAKEFYVTQIYKGCEGSFQKVKIEILDAPNGNFIASSICEGRDFTLTGPQNSGIPYPKYAWDFGDGADTVVMNNNLVTHNYGPGSASRPPFTIKLTVTNSLFCTNKDSLTNLSVNINPKPKFNYQFVCDKDMTEFQGSANISVNEYKWDFGDSSPILGPGSFANPKHQFTNGAGSYKVKMTAYTSVGCSNTDSTSVNILKFITHNSLNPYDITSLDGGKGFWTIEDLKDSTTWEFAVPNKTIIKSTTPVWVTNANGIYKANDASVLNSPCLNISGFERPVISFDFISKTQQKVDGTVLECSIDNGVKWQAVGSGISGQNWFNTVGFSSGKIGNSQVGWSGDLTGLNNSWLQGKHALESSIPLAKRNKVRFRIAFGSNGDDENEGFAFTKLSISERNRVMLVENFTNESDPKYKENNTAFVNSLVSNEFVKLQYNLPFPGTDIISLDNETDPTARAAFYGITNDGQLLPRVYIDGKSEGNLTTNWFVNFASLRSLKTSPFAIRVSTMPASSPGELKVSASAKALQNITSPGFVKPIMHLAIVEKTVGINEYVLRKLLPSPAGIEVSMPLNKNDSIATGPLTWFVSSSTDPTDIAIIAFIQDEVTKEVYQAELLKNPTNLPTIVTGTEPTLANQIAIYPNPADQSVTIQLPQAVHKQTPIKIFDVNGHQVHNTFFEQGSRSKVLSTQDLASGVYLLELEIGENMVRKKVIVMH